MRKVINGEWVLTGICAMFKRRIHDEAEKSISEAQNDSFVA